VELFAGIAARDFAEFIDLERELLLAITGLGRGNPNGSSAQRRSCDSQGR
jgi:hypothetical protein